MCKNESRKIGNKVPLGSPAGMFRLSSILIKHFFVSERTFRDKSPVTKRVTQ